MEWKIAQDEKWVCLKPLGERLDFDNSNEFREQVKRVVNRGEKHLILDLSKVTFIDSTALGVIVSNIRLLKPGFDLYVCNADPEIRSVFELTKLDKVLRLADSVEAVQSELQAGS